jgi:sec-independent protein translocase protein TatA
VITGFLEGYDLLIVLAIIALLFGGSQLPKLARSLGSASHEFRKGLQEGMSGEAKPGEAKPGEAKPGAAGGSDAPASGQAG